ncbi:MAG: (deoxy)nucleoside triphosphate pyrophosphohydrolase [Vulcanimicrobiota bacterium]
MKDPYVTVTCAVIRCNGAVLIAKRKNGAQAGKWEFPGGKVEEGETPEESLAREMKEECSVSVRVGAFLAESLHRYENFSIRLLAYEAELLSGDLHLSDHDEVRWVSQCSLLSHDLAAADIAIARVLAS